MRREEALVGGRLGRGWLELLTLLSLTCQQGEWWREGLVWWIVCTAVFYIRGRGAGEEWCEGFVSSVAFFLFFFIFMCSSSEVRESQTLGFAVSVFSGG